MRAARSLADLMRIRAHPKNRDILDGINQNLGTALGFKKATNQPVSEEPAIIVFVPQKVDEFWLPEGFPDKLSIPGKGGKPGIECKLDYVEGGKSERPVEVEEADNAVTKVLRGKKGMLRPGSQLAVIDSRGNDFVATLGAFVHRRKKKKKQLGFLTNEHVALKDEPVFHPCPEVGRSIGRRRSGDAIESLPVEEWYGPAAKELGVEDSKVRVDCAFVRLDKKISADRIDTGIIERGALGPLLEIDLNEDMVTGSSRILGKRVLKAGRTTGVRFGTITAFAYEWVDEAERTRYTDLLVSPMFDSSVPGSRSIPFSLPGDSGSLVVLEKGLRPIGLLWGGYVEKLAKGRFQESWSYVTRLDKILSRLDATLV